MTLTLLLIALLQDGPIQTAPPAVPVAPGVAGQIADPGPVCTFGGRPVMSPGCPAPQGRIAIDAPVPPRPATDGPALTRVEDCSLPANRRPGEAEIECISRFRTDQWMRSVQADSQEIEWSGPVAGAAERRAEYCALEANRGTNETGFDCALRLSHAQQPDRRVGSLGFRVAPDNPDIPAWAFSDPARWELSQCGAEGDDACRRQARNRLAMARAGVAAAAPAAGGDAAPDNCRMVMRRSQEGFGGSLSRVCGDGAEVEAALARLQGASRPAVEPCDRPAALETQDAWIARCRALPPR